MKSVVIFKQLAIESNINWVTEVKYLGLYIRSGQKCNCNFDKQKSKFYRSANCIFTKHGNLNSEHSSYPTPRALHWPSARPTLTCSESTSFDKNTNHFYWTSLVLYHNVSTMNVVYHCMSMKIFKTFDSAIVQKCYMCMLIVCVLLIWVNKRYSYCQLQPSGSSSWQQHLATEHHKSMDRWRDKDTWTVRAIRYQLRQGTRRLSWSYWQWWSWGSRKSPN